MSPSLIQLLPFQLMPFWIFLILLPCAITAFQVPYLRPDISNFQPDGKTFAYEAGEYAAKLCTWLGREFPNLVQGYQVDPHSSFGQYYPTGTNPSLELLVQTYPPGVIDEATAKHMPKILKGVGPDIYITKDQGYGKIDPTLVNHGPLGALPAFCRYGAYIKTSPHTKALFEVWMPLAIHPSVPLAPVNASDFPTPSTPHVLDCDGNVVMNPPPKHKHASSSDISFNESDDDQFTKDSAETFEQESPSLETRSIVSQDSDLPTSKESENRKRRQTIAKHERRSGHDVLGRQKGWNGRLIQINNGAQRGAVPHPDFKQLMSRYMFAVSGTNAGHFSNPSDTSWVVGPHRQETIRDWSSRSYAYTTDVSRQVIDYFYGPQSGQRVKVDNAYVDSPIQDGKSYTTTKNRSTKRLRTYMAGASVGGGSAMGAIQEYGPQWDGVLVIAPALDFSDINFVQLELAKTHRKTTVGEGVFDARIFGNEFHQAVLDQCDMLDGVKDGILNEPWKCTLDFEKAIGCNQGGPYSNNTDVCFNPAQLDNLKNVFQPWSYDGKLFFGAYPLGIEDQASMYRRSAKKSIGWIEQAILGNTKSNSTRAYSNEPGVGYGIDQVELGRRLNIGGSNRDKTDLDSFFSGNRWGGGKIMMFHGTSDIVINYNSTVRYYQSVLHRYGTQLYRRFKFFTIPGMHHCRGGCNSSWNAGLVTQNHAGNRPLYFTPKYDALVSLIDWVENGETPKYQIGVSYKCVSRVLSDSQQEDDDEPTMDNRLIPTWFQNYECGVTVSRKLCPYPNVGVYSNHGDTNGPKAWKNFDCKPSLIPGF